ncbi:MAG: response regulator [Bacteroidales bacterium]|nr:response regulator [Bacteroidales bacterium]
MYKHSSNKSLTELSRAMKRLIDGDDSVHLQKSDFESEFAELVDDVNELAIVFAQRKQTEQIQNLLYNISYAGAITVDLEELIKLIRKELEALIDTTNFFVALYNPQTDSISLPFFADQNDSFTLFPAGKTLTRYVISTQKTLFVTKEKIKKLEKSDHINIIGSEPEVWLGIPLEIEGEVSGALVVQSYTDENAFDESHVKILEFVSDQISVAIERKRIEEHLKNALAKATESDQLKTAFLNTMSHELRTPLNSIIGFSQIIDQDTSTADVLEYSKMIQKGGQQLQKIIADIMNATIIIGDELSVEKEICFLNPLLEDLFVHLKNEIREKQKDQIIALFKPAHAGTDITVELDLNSFRRIIKILLSNAVKFTQMGLIELGYLIKDNRNIIFYVKDSGIGISDSNKKVVFDLFRQGDDSHTREYGGMGLGLFLAKKLVELLGGVIWLESDPGKGSTFYFSIPCLKFPVVMSVPDLSDKTLLVVEDNNLNFILIEKMLTPSGAHVIWAKNGLEAVQICEINHHIDLVLMDVNIPEVDGVTATQKIKRIHPGLPVVAVSAYDIPTEIEGILRAGLDDFLSKPVNHDDLFEMVEKYI